VLPYEKDTIVAIGEKFKENTRILYFL